MTLYFDAFTRFGRRMKQHRAHPWTFDHLRAELDHCSISAALVADTRCVHYDAMHSNLRLLDTLKPHDHLFPIWNVHPHHMGDFPEPAELTALLKKHDVRAVTIYPTENGWNPLSKTSEPLLRELEKTKTLTLLEFGGPGAELPDDKLEPLLDLYPELPLLVHKTRWNRQRLVVPLLLRHKNLHLGFEDFQMHMGPEFFVEKGLEDQLIFCSNAPSMSAGAHRAYIDYADIPQSAKDKFAHGNLTRLLKGLKPPGGGARTHQP